MKCIGIKERVTPMIKSFQHETNVLLLQDTDHLLVLFLLQHLMILLVVPIQLHTMIELSCTQDTGKLYPINILFLVEIQDVWTVCFVATV